MLKVVSASATTNQAAACWVVTNSTADPHYAYVSNAVSGSISGYDINPQGALSLLDPDGRTGGFDTTSDMPDTSNEMTITAFRIETDGSLSIIPGPGGFPPSTQGIAAT